jgi:hypothetical protein
MRSIEEWNAMMLLLEQRLMMTGRLRHWGYVYARRCRAWALAPALAANTYGPARHSRTPCLPGASSSSSRGARLDRSGHSITLAIAMSALGQKRSFTVVRDGHGRMSLEQGYRHL